MISRLRHLLYLGYFIFNTDFSDVRQSLECATASRIRRAGFLCDMVCCSLIYGTSFVDYFNFRFFEKPRALRKQYAGMGFMRDFHARLNSRRHLPEIDNKQQFARNFAALTYPSFDLSAASSASFEAWLQQTETDAVVLKDPSGTTGKGIEFFDVHVDGDGRTSIDGFSSMAEFLTSMAERNLSHAEPYVQQHPTLRKLSPQSLNTVRVITIVDKMGEPHIIGAILRIGWHSRVDNFSAGNLAAEVDVDSGVVVTGAIRKRAACDRYRHTHPVSGERILGLRLPFWNEVLELCRCAALVNPKVRTVGWDVALTEDGPLLVEGNPKWGKDGWQIPADRGKKEVLARFLSE